jgi:hypothetical protein
VRPARPRRWSAAAGDADGGEARQAAGGVEARYAGLAAIDHHAHALDGQAGLGDGGGQHNLAAALGRRTDRAVLVAGVERAIERGDLDGRVADAFGQALGGSKDLALAGQEDQHASGFLCERALDGADDAVLQAQPLVTPEVVGRDREGAALALDDRGRLQQPGDRGAVEGGRHDQQLQVLAQHPLRVAGQGEAQVGVEAALVELVEDHAGDAGQRRVGQDLPREDALGDHLDAGGGGDLRLHPHPEADRLAHGLAEGGGHPLGGGAGGQAAGLEDDDPALPRPGLGQQLQRDDRGLAGARWGHKHSGAPLRERRLQPRKSFVDR